MIVESDNSKISDCQPDAMACARRAGTRWQFRLTAAIIAMACASILVTAACIAPQPSGIGSHTQLQLPACGFLQRNSYPCPTCGMTTAVAYLVRGRVIMAFITQPAGALAGLLCLAVTCLAGYAAVTAKQMDKYIDFISFNFFYIVITVGVIVLLSWLWTCLRIKLYSNV
jgi:hypothetical protein